MSGARTVQAQQQRIEAMIAALESVDDNQASALARELLRVVLDLHAGGLARVMEIVSMAGIQDNPVVEALVRDPAVCALLNLHGLHPHDLPTRVARAVEHMRAALGTQGVTIELRDAAEEAVRVQVSGRLQGKHALPESLRQEIEQAIFEQAPEVVRVEIAGLADIDVHELRFVPAREMRGPDRQGRVGGGQP